MLATTDPPGTFLPLLHLALCQGGRPLFMDPTPRLCRGIGQLAVLTGDREGKGWVSIPLALSWGPCRVGPSAGDISSQETLLPASTPMSLVPEAPWCPSLRPGDQLLLAQDPAISLGTAHTFVNGFFPKFSSNTHFECAIWFPLETDTDICHRFPK